MPYATTIILVGPKQLEGYFVFIYTQFFQISIDDQITDLVVRVILYVEGGKLSSIEMPVETILHERDVYYD